MHEHIWQVYCEGCDRYVTPRKGCCYRTEVDSHKAASLHGRWHNRRGAR